MKNKRIVISILICSIIMLICTILFVYSSSLVTREKGVLAYIDDVSVITTSTTTKKEYERIIIEAKGDISDDVIKVAYEELRLIPDKLQNLFVASSWHLVLSNDNLSKVYFNNKYKSVLGLTDYASSSIIIEAKEKSIRESLVHEMGHFLDYITGFETFESTFKNNFYNVEINEFKKHIKNPGCVRDPQELFAEEFYYMFKDPSKCTPLVLNLIQNKLNSI